MRKKNKIKKEGKRKHKMCMKNINLGSQSIWKKNKKIQPKFTSAINNIQKAIGNTIKNINNNLNHNNNTGFQSTIVIWEKKYLKILILNFILFTFFTIQISHDI